MKVTRAILFATILSTLGFAVALSINAPEQPVLELTLNNIAVTFFGMASIIGSIWLISRRESK